MAVNPNVVTTSGGLCWLLLSKLQPIGEGISTGVLNIVVSLNQTKDLYGPDKWFFLQ